MEDEEKDVDKSLDDLEEDHREEGESINDDLKTNEHNAEDESIDKDIAEDHREEGESIEDLKFEIEGLKTEIARLTRERDEANSRFLRGSKEYEPYKRDYESIKGDIK